MEDINKFLETCDLDERVLPLVSLKLSEEDPEKISSITVQFGENIVGNWKSCYECIFEEEKTDLFSKSLMGTTIQDSSTRERRGGKSKINLVAGITSVITIIQVMFCNYTTWFILYLIAKSLASINVMFIV